MIPCKVFPTCLSDSQPPSTASQDSKDPKKTTHKISLETCLSINLVMDRICDFIDPQKIPPNQFLINKTITRLNDERRLSKGQLCRKAIEIYKKLFKKSLNEKVSRLLLKQNPNNLEFSLERLGIKASLTPKDIPLALMRLAKKPEESSESPSLPRHVAIFYLSAFVNEKSIKQEIHTVLLQASQDKTMFVRWRAAQALGAIKEKSPETIGALLKLYKDENYIVRLYASDALASVEKPSQKISEAFLNSLQTNPESSTLPQILKYLKHPSEKRNIYHFIHSINKAFLLTENDLLGRLKMAKFFRKEKLFPILHEYNRRCLLFLIEHQNILNDPNVLESSSQGLKNAFKLAVTSYNFLQLIYKNHLALFNPSAIQRKYALDFLGELGVDDWKIGAFNKLSEIIQNRGLLEDREPSVQTAACLALCKVKTMDASLLSKVKKNITSLLERKLYSSPELKKLTRILAKHTQKEDQETITLLKDLAKTIKNSSTFENEVGIIASRGLFNLGFYDINIINLLMQNLSNSTSFDSQNSKIIKALESAAKLKPDDVLLKCFKAISKSQFPWKYISFFNGLLQTSLSQNPSKEYAQRIHQELEKVKVIAYSNQELAIAFSQAQSTFQSCSVKKSHPKNPAIIFLLTLYHLWSQFLAYLLSFT